MNEKELNNDKKIIIEELITKFNDEIKHLIDDENDGFHWPNCSGGKITKIQNKYNKLINEIIKN